MDDNVALLRRSYDAFNRRDLDALLALCDPEIEIASRILQVEGGGAYHGHDGVREWWRNILEVAADLRTDADEVRAIGDVTVTRLRVHGHGTESRAPVEQTQWEVTGWRDGLMTRWAIYMSEEEALDAARRRA